MTKSILTAAAFTLALAVPVSADPSVGFGLSFSFGGGSVDYGVGVRVFSDDKQDKFAASVGLDYMFQSQRWRPTVGAAYLGDNSYIGLDMGFGLNGEGIDFGVGVGGVNTDEPAEAVAPVVTPPVVTPPVVTGPGDDPVRL
jgi:opacity protein-like surface antigen